MTTQEILSRLDGVQRSGRGYMARCPAHDDRKASLSISTGQDGSTLLYCHAGCSTEDVLASMGLHLADLYPSKEVQPKPLHKARRQHIATYDYLDDDGNLLAQKLRYSDKSFSWRRPDGKGGWINNRESVPHRLYAPAGLCSSDGLAWLAEGEKDVDNLVKIGFTAASGAHGAGPGKWHDEYTAQLAGKDVLIFQDNDEIGKAYAREIAAAIYKTVESVRILDLEKVWPEIPEKGDVSDFLEAKGTDIAVSEIMALCSQTEPWTPEEATKNDPFFSCFGTVEEIEEEEAEWLIPDWIPKGQITLIAADGGVGKTTLWCNLIAALSSGKSCILDPPGHTRQPQKVAFLTTEDSVKKKLRQKLRVAGADLKNIITVEQDHGAASVLRSMKFGSWDMERFIKHFRPSVCVFDPVQGFVPPDINMGSRNAMRDCMAPLVSLGEETGTTFLVICHTNKRKAAHGRDRIADSADLWDISRSVLMAGYTEEEGVRYLSNEKNNYSQLQQTILFSIGENGNIQLEGTTSKRDRDYTQEAALSLAPHKKADCKAWILQELHQYDGRIATKELEENAKAAGYGHKTIRNAKEELKKENRIKYIQEGTGKEKVWYIDLIEDTFTQAEEDTYTPWDKIPAPV